MWGLYDYTDNTWVGDDKGPKAYKEVWTAKVAARVFDVMMKQAPGRTKERELPPGSYRHKEKLAPELTAIQALQALEDGKVL